MGVAKIEGELVSVKSTDENNHGNNNKTVLVDIREVEGDWSGCFCRAPDGRESIKLLADNQSEEPEWSFERRYYPREPLGDVDGSVINDPVLLLNIVNLLGYVVNVNLITSGNEEEKESAKSDFNYYFSTFKTESQLSIMNSKKIKKSNDEMKPSPLPQQQSAEKGIFTVNLHCSYPGSELFESYPYFSVPSFIDTSGKLWQVDDGKSEYKNSITQLTSVKSMAEAMRLIIGSVLGYNVSFTYEYGNGKDDECYEYES
ncbi:MAG: hypothetical protein EB127_18590 [Alphaproteobacteria bacterium]|jgi:hypothetical protein|nr:hypothetical protein [Alphaproteobacteria bacterium]